MLIRCRRTQKQRSRITTLPKPPLSNHDQLTDWGFEPSHCAPDRSACSAILQIAAGIVSTHSRKPGYSTHDTLHILHPHLRCALLSDLLLLLLLSRKSLLLLLTISFLPSRHYMQAETDIAHKLSLYHPNLVWGRLLPIGLHCCHDMLETGIIKGWTTHLGTTLAHLRTASTGNTEMRCLGHWHRGCTAHIGCLGDIGHVLLW